MDILATLKKLHEQFPQLSLDDLLAILDCYVEKNNFFKPYENKIWHSNSNTITANSNQERLYGNITANAKGSRFTTGGNN